jgi:predicted ATPase/tRNA A-37 threonylcarbamoyl transferase component Bud32
LSDVAGFREGLLLGNRYRLSAQIGAGGMGVVYEAYDESLKRRVAVKLLPPDAQTDRVARERLRGEARAAAALDHPFICKVHELGEHDGTLFVVMEYIEGETLHDLAARGLLPIRQILEIAIEAVEALDEAHRRGLVHRDLKPANLMLTAQGHVKVMDFGLAKPVRTRDGQDDATRGVLTDAGTRVGTSGYMSPEQILGAPLDPRSDIFSLGVVVYELATGQHPFRRPDAAETMSAILRDPPRGGTRDLEDGPALAAVVRRMLAKACAERPQSMAELRSELEGLRDQTRSSGASASAVATPGQATERTPFVGREAETAELWQMLDRMLVGQGGLVLVGGEPGVGKTRLARELQKFARQRGCLGLTGHCYEMEGAPPFVPFAETVEEAVRLVPRAVRAAMGPDVAEIASIVPSLHRVFDDIPPMPDVPGDQRRRLVFSAVLEYLRRGSMKSPGVMLLDDLHWADEPTLQLLAHLAPHLSSMRILVVGTYRDVELDVGRPFARTLEALLRQRLATRIALRRLDEQGVAGMLAALGGTAPPSGLSRAVYHETEGNPFFVEEVYQHLAEEGKLFDDDGHWREDLRVGAIEVPEGVRLVVGRRLDRLGDQARKVLTAGAIIGRTFPLRLLLGVVDVPEDDALDAMEQAERAQLVTVDASRRAVRYEFVHELIRTTLVDSLSLPRRQRLHLRIADAIERTGTAAEDPPSVLAHHLYQAGAAVDTTRAAHALAAAGRAADDASAFEETLETFDRLLSLELPESDPLVAEAFERRGSALAGLGRHEEAASSSGRALTLYMERSDEPGIVRSARMAASEIGWLGRASESEAIRRRAIEALRPDAVDERAQLQAALAISLANQGRLEEARLELEAAVAAAEPLGGRVFGSVLMGALFVSYIGCGFLTAIEVAQRALMLLPEEAAWERAQTLALLALSLWETGRLDEAEAVLAPLDLAVRRTGNPGAQFALGLVAPAVGLARTGDWQGFRSAVEPQLTRPVYTSVFRMALAGAELQLGNEDRALAELARAVDEQRTDNHVYGVPQAARFAATALAGHGERARTLLPTVEPFLPVEGRRNSLGRLSSQMLFVEGLALLGDVERCARMYPLARWAVDTGSRMPTWSMSSFNAQLAAATAADAAGMAKAADEHFATAAREAREIPFRPLQPVTLYWHGRSIAARTGTGDRERGRAMVAAALEDFRALGMVPYARLAEQFRAE